MSNRLGWLAVLALPLAILARPAAAGLVLKAKSLVCGGSGPAIASVAVTARDAVVTLKFKAKELVANETVMCGFFCNAVGSGGVELPCGTVDENGKWSNSLEQPQSLCYGFIPFFNTGSTGVCVPSTAP